MLHLDFNAYIANPIFIEMTKSPIAINYSALEDNLRPTGASMATSVQSSMFEEIMPPSRFASDENLPIQRELLELQMDLILCRRENHMLHASNAELRRQLANLMQQEAQARVYAYRDELTGLPNRRLLMDRVQHAISNAERHRKRLALLMIDLDGFKQVNDTLGHATGDHLLRLVAGRLKTYIRADDTACRYGGDEFVVLLSDLDDDHSVEEVRARIDACLGRRYLISGQELPVRASVGAAVFPADGKSFHDLLARADADMYRNKSVRRRTFDDQSE